MAGIVKTGQAVTAVFATSSPATGAATSADSTPTGTLYVNGTADAATVTVTNITTGRYKAAVTLPTLAAGDVVDIWIAATVGGIAGGGVVWSAAADTKRLSDTLSADMVAISGDSAAADNLEAAADGTGYNLGGGSVVAASVTGAVGSVTGHTPQTGDSFARIGAAGAGLTAVGDTAGTTTLLSRITALLQTKAEADTAHGLLATSASLTAAQAALAALINALNDIAAADVWTALDDASANKIADHVLRRSWATAAGSADGDALAFRSLLGAVAKLVNRVGISGATLTVYEDDDLTALGTQAVTSDAAAEPITGVNTV